MPQVEFHFEGISSSSITVSTIVSDIAVPKEGA